MIIALTGHREKRLNLPTDVSLPEWNPIRDWIRTEIITRHATEVFTGMASGSDMAIAYEVAKMKQEGYNIILTCVLPCKGYGTRTPNYQFVKESADNVIEIHNKWVKGCDDDRDDYMAKNCDLMLAIFDGNKCGGVWRTMNMAHDYKKDIICCPLNLLT